MDNNPYYTHQMHISERTRQLHTFKNEDGTDKKINQNSKSYKEMDKEYYNLLNEKNIKKESIFSKMKRDIQIYQKRIL